MLPSREELVLTEEVSTNSLMLTPQECEIVLLVRSIKHGTVQVRIQDNRPVLAEVNTKYKLA